MQLGHQPPDVDEPPTRYVEVLLDELGDSDSWRCTRRGAVAVDREAHDGFHDRIDW